LTEYEMLKDNKMKPETATATVYKMIDGVRCPFSATARWKEYYPGEKQGFLWDKMPFLMLGKCAEALALRKSFPCELSGVYTTEEMGQADTTSVEPEIHTKAPKPQGKSEMITEAQAEMIKTRIINSRYFQFLPDLHKTELNKYEGYTKKRAIICLDWWLGKNEEKGERAELVTKHPEIEKAEIEKQKQATEHRCPIKDCKGTMIYTGNLGNNQKWVCNVCGKAKLQEVK